ncbi:hypothetical protein BR93DRAFT_281211 [Coniochaeta sp. PMI_546]|nr:hypothetical protein BR93DRAFT_281211 [Coniochaeta sp. PMI_546]
MPPARPALASEFPWCGTDYLTPRVALHLLDSSCRPVIHPPSSERASNGPLALLRKGKGSWNLEDFADDCRIWRNRRGRKPERRITWLTHVPRVSSVVPPVVSLVSFISLLPINLLFFPFPLTSTGEAHNNLSTGAVCCHRLQNFFTEIFAVTSFDTSKLSAHPIVGA